MAIPMVIMTSSRALMDVADYVMITGLRLPEAQAAMLPAQTIMWSYIVMGIGLVSVVNTFASQALGRGDPKLCSAYGWQSLYIAVALGLLGVAVRPLLPALIGWFGHDAGVQAMELAYTRVALLTTAPTIASYGLAWFFVGVHRPWTATWSAIEANVVNIVVSYVLIYGYLGFTAHGIAGAAWGTFAAVSYRAIRLSLTMLTPAMACGFDTRRTWRLAWRPLRDLLRVGIPCSVQWICDVTVWAIFVNVLIGSKFGTAHLIATNSAWQYMRIAFLPTMGVGQALTALVGRSIGARLPDRAMRETRMALIVTLAYMGTLSTLYTLFGGWLIARFNADPEVVRIGRTIMYCAACFQLFDAIAITYNSALRGAGDTFVPSLFFIISNWLIIVGGGSLMVRFYPSLGSLGPWLAASLLITIAGVFHLWRWRSLAWMRIDLFAGGAEGKTTNAPNTGEDSSGTVVATDTV